MTRLALFALALIASPALAQTQGAVPFDAKWQEQRFPFQKGNEFTPEGESLLLRSEGGVSLFYRRTPDHADAKAASWDWDVRESVPPTDLTQKGGDDRNMALYFLFADPETAEELSDASLRSLMNEENVRILVYTRGGNNETDTVLENPYLGDRGRTIVLETAGTGDASETVDLSNDLGRAFDTRPETLVGIAVSADSDATDTVIDATLSNLTLE